MNDTRRRRYAGRVDGVHIAIRYFGKGPVDAHLREDGSTQTSRIVGSRDHRSGGLVRWARVDRRCSPVRQARDGAVGPAPDARPRDTRRRPASGARCRRLGPRCRDGRRRRWRPGGVLRGDPPGARAGPDPQRGVRARCVGARLPDRAEGGGLPRRPRRHGQTMGARSSSRRSGSIDRRPRSRTTPSTSSGSRRPCGTGPLPRPSSSSKTCGARSTSARRWGACRRRRS